jgi:hypothetical protein
VAFAPAWSSSASPAAGSAALSERAHPGPARTKWAAASRAARLSTWRWGLPSRERLPRCRRLRGLRSRSRRRRRRRPAPTPPAPGPSLAPTDHRLPGLRSRGVAVSIVASSQCRSWPLGGRVRLAARALAHDDRPQLKNGVERDLVAAPAPIARRRSVDALTVTKPERVVHRGGVTNMCQVRRQGPGAAW